MPSEQGILRVGWRTKAELAAHSGTCPDLANGLFDYDTRQHVLH